MIQEMILLINRTTTSLKKSVVNDFAELPTNEFFNLHVLIFYTLSIRYEHVLSVYLHYPQFLHDHVKLNYYQLTCSHR